MVISAFVESQANVAIMRFLRGTFGQNFEMGGTKTVKWTRLYWYKNVEHIRVETFLVYHSSAPIAVG